MSYGPGHVSEAGGIRTPTVQIKSLLCCRYTTTPCVVRCICFDRCSVSISHLLIVCLSSSPRRSRTFVSALSGRHPQPLNDRAVCFSVLKVRVIGFEPTISWSQATRVPKLPHTRRLFATTVRRQLPLEAGPAISRCQFSRNCQIPVCSDFGTQQPAQDSNPEYDVRSVA